MPGGGKGNKTSGNKKRGNVGNRPGPRLNKGPRMSEVLRGEMPANAEAEIEARRSDAPVDALPPDAAAIRRWRGQS